MSVPATVVRSADSPNEKVRKKRGGESYLDPSNVVDENGSSSQKVRLSWEHMTYTVPVRYGKAGQTKTILTDVSGYVEAGELLAIMGPSGSGKTTLLDTLSDRAGQGVLTGSVKVNGVLRDSSFTKYTRYVPQEDSLMGVLTVREVLSYAADFTLPGMSQREKDGKVQAAIKSMGLASCQDGRIGDLFFKGITSGQKRRVSMALHLLATPAIMILDEPTSGLDSAASMGVFEVIKGLASTQNEAVLFTVHQPPSEMFRNFDKLMMLVGGGVAYYGQSSDMVSYFSKLGFECPVYSNPADYALGLINGDFDGHADIQLICDSYASSDNQTNLMSQIESQGREGYTHQDAFDEFLSRTTSNEPFNKAWYQFKVLSRRQMLNATRNPGLYGLRLVLYVMLGVMIGTMYWDIGNDFSTVQDRAALTAYVGSFMVFMSIAVVPFFIEFRAVFVLETSNNFYDIGPYVVSHYLTGLPGMATIALCASSCVYFAAGLHSGRYFVFLLNLFLSLTTAEAFMSLVSAIVPHYVVGMAVAAGVYGMFMLSQGFLVIFDNIPTAWKWSYHVAFHAYQWRVYMYNEFHDLELTEAPFFENKGDKVLEHFSIEDTEIVEDLLTQLAFGLFFELCFYLVLKYMHDGKR